MNTRSRGFNKKRVVAATSALLKPSKSIVLAGALVCSSVLAQQGGSIKGKVTTELANKDLAGITVTAVSNVMPKPRTAVTKADGSFNLPLLLPGTYTLTYEAADGTVYSQQVQVVLDKASSVSLPLQLVDNDIERITVTGSVFAQVGDSSLSTSLGSDVVNGVPVGTQYRDLLKLIPGVQMSENDVLGPSAGGSGRDNKYGFDGVDVSLPMFGNLASEPSTHDIESVSMDRGGAKAIGFNRSGGFAINTVSKSGTNEFKGHVEYKLQNKNFVADKDDTDGTKFTLDKSWLSGSVSGPVIEDELFFYASYYRPETTREGKVTSYGPVKDYESTRQEYYGKLTWAPTEDLLFNLSMRSSDRDGRGQSIGPNDADSTSYGDDAKQDILTFDGSYIIDDYTTLSFQYSQFSLETQSAPDTLYANVVPELNTSLSLGQLDQIGLFRVPELRDDEGFDTDAAQVLIDQYGYVNDEGGRSGGGSIGGHYEINNQNFYRDSFEVKLTHERDFGDTTHELHFGFKWAEGEEELSRMSNGWGAISFIGGLQPDDFESETPVYYVASVEQMSFVGEDGQVVSPINSVSESLNFEFNDTIIAGDFTYNIGFLISKDTLYGEGLKEKSGTVSGFELAPGNQYKMHETEWKDMIQPRLGVTWSYNGDDDNVFANYAEYNPEASSLARAASWGRNTRRTLLVYFDEAGDYIGNTEAAGSSGKFFQEGIKPRQIQEYTIGTQKLVTDELMVRGHARHRKGSHFWEDTWNGSRGYGEYGPFGGVPAHIAEKGLYIPNLDDMRAEVGGSSYVIAELDDAFTKYWEVSLEAEYKTDRIYLNASYVWSHYYGNYDQDITSGASDGNLFIGSSNLADGKGRQIWDGKYGKLNGDKPHLLKAFGYYTTDWDANIGAYFLFQSGDVWEKWDGEVYGYSSSTIRYAEHAGSRREPSHWQMDLSYAQNFEVIEGYNLQFRADIFNIFDKQTGYNYNPYASSDDFGKPRDLYSPRRLQLTFKMEF